MSLTLASDWIGLFCTMIQTFVAVLALWLANGFWRQKDRRDRIHQQERQARQRNEQLEREEREKIAEIFGSEFYKIQKDIENFKNTIVKLKTTPIIDCETYNISGLDVLRYMFQSDQFKTDELDSLSTNIDKIVRLFQSFRVKLPPILPGRRCPQNIQEELGPIVNEVGNLILPFVPTVRQNTVIHVLSYFGASNLEPFPDITDLNIDIPYINNLRLHIPNSQSTGAEITFETGRMLRLIPSFLGIESSIAMNRPEMCGKIPQIVHCLRKFWTSQKCFEGTLPQLDLLKRTNALHLIRLSINKLHRHEVSLRNDEAFKLLKNELNDLKKISPSSVISRMSSVRSIDNIVWEVGGWKEEQFQQLLEQKETSDFLHSMENLLDEFKGKNQRYFRWPS